MLLRDTRQKQDLETQRPTPLTAVLCLLSNCSKSLYLHLENGKNHVSVSHDPQPPPGRPWRQRFLLITGPFPQGGVLGIKIGWVCDLDRAWDQCIPKYSFTRLDGVSEKSSVSPGYNFR